MEPITASAARLAGLSLLRLQSDERLAELAALGNSTAFEALVRRYRGGLVRSCQRVLSDGQAEDAVQQALLKAHQAVLRNGAPDNFGAWLHRIAVNSALDLAHRDRTSELPAEETLAGGERPDEAHERRERLTTIVGAIKSLPGRQRRAIVLREFEGRSHNEVARELGMSAGAARQLIHRARNNVRSAASALTPPAFLLRLLAAGGGGTANPAEIAAGGAAGGFAAKAAVAAIVAGGVAGGATLGPLDRGGDGERAIAPERAEAASVPDGASHGGGAHAFDSPRGAGSSEDANSHPGPGGGQSQGQSGQGGGHSDPGEEGGDDGSASSGDDSGSSGSGSSGSGSSGSGSGSSGSGSSGSGSSGSGSSGPGSSDDDSGSSGSGSSGSGSSDSGSVPSIDSSESGEEPRESDAEHD